MPKKSSRVQKLTTFAAMTKSKVSARGGGGKRSGAGVKVVAPKRTASNPALVASKLGVPPQKVSKSKGRKRY